jgi:Holliday junction resolvasome RuvABC endonuclease subunit
MKILALDPATNTGFAHSGGISGTWDLSPRRDESRSMRLIRFKGKLNEVLAAEGIDLVVFEAARHAASNGALVVQAEIQGVLKLWCEEREIPYQGYGSTEVKKHATGKGKAKKAAMVEAAKKRWPGFNGDDNEADAKWILDMAQSRLGVAAGGAK